MAQRTPQTGKPAAGPSLVAGSPGGAGGKAAAAAGVVAPAQALLTQSSTSGSQRRQDRQYIIEIPKKLATTATTSSRAAVDRILANKNKKYKVAKRLLKLLKRSFLAVPDYNYELGHPSHLWDNEASKAEFYQLCLELCAEAEPLFKRERMLLLFDDSPAYVLGDIHGNYKDLMLFEKTFWRLGLKLCPANILCLGDYVDRGPHSVETIAYLLAQKVICPNKIFLIRGNHEVRDVNGDFQVYGKTSFLYQCTELLGTVKGKKVWEVFNNCFDQMPISAIIDQKVFCVHGGVPRQLMRARERILQEIDHIPKGYVDIGKNELVNDLLWADPSVSNEEKYIQPSDRFPEGFAPNGLRGGEACVFGAAAVQYFGRVTGCSHIIRAHQPPDLGISLGKNAKVITVFSSSHYCGQFNSAAIVLVADYKIHVIVTTHNEKLRDSPRNSAGALDAPVPIQNTLEYRTPNVTQAPAEEEEDEPPLDVRGVVPPLVGRQGGGQASGAPGQTGTGLPPLSPSASLLTNMMSSSSSKSENNFTPSAPAPTSAPQQDPPLSPRSQAAAVNEFARRSKLYQAPVDPPAAASPSATSAAPTAAAGTGASANPGAAAAGVKPRTFSRQLGFQRSQSASTVTPGSPGVYGTLPKNVPSPVDFPMSSSVPPGGYMGNGSNALSQSYSSSSPLTSTSPKKGGDNPLAKQLDSLGHSSPLLEAFATLNNALNRQEPGAAPQP